MADKSMFETVLASTIHDMKNSLSYLLGQLDVISERLQVEDENYQAVSTIRYESTRINHALMQLLTLYKLEQNQLYIQRVDVDVEDFIDDCVAVHSELAARNKIQLNVECEDVITWSFDPDIISIALNNIISNSLRYSSARLTISVRIENGQLVIEIDDDGDGYPDFMLRQSDNFKKEINSQTGSTGLGLFFADTVAKSHQREGKQGVIHLENGGTLGGGRFQLYLP